MSTFVERQDDLYYPHKLPPHATGEQGPAFRAIGIKPRPARPEHGSEEMIAQGCVCFVCRNFW